MSFAWTLIGPTTDIAAPHKLHNQKHSSYNTISPVIYSQQQSVDTRIIDLNPGFDFKKIGIQPKLRLSQPGDEYEQEADRVAEQVMRMSAAISKMERIDRESSTRKLKDNHKMEIGRTPSLAYGLDANDQATNEINNIRSSGGSALDANTREFMESRFGYDFGSIRIHTGGQAARSASSVNALAYTVANHIVFGASQYQPDSFDGRRLIAHELVHVIHQSGTDSSYQMRNRNSGQQNLVQDAKPLFQKEPALSISPVVIQRQSRYERRTEEEIADARTERRVQRGIDEDRELMRPEGGRDRRRSTGGDLDSDWAGRALLLRYLTGGGEWTINDHPDWSRYMKANALLRSNLRGRVTQMAQDSFDSALQTPISVEEVSTPVHATFPMEIENGEGIIGYHYLHGTNSTVGGFQVSGNARRTSGPEGTVVVLDLSYTWNDIIDPNPQYGTDTLKSWFAEAITLGQADGYTVHIRWTSQAIVRFDQFGTMVYRGGWPFDNQ